MKDFFRFNIWKLIVALAILVFIFPIFKIEPIVHPCQIPPCPYTDVSNGFLILKEYNYPSITGINVSPILLVGILVSYFITSAIFFLNKKDFLIVIATVLVQVGSIFVVSGILFYFFTYPSQNIKNLAQLLCLTLISFLTFWFFGRRKRVLLFTLALPALFLSVLLHNLNLI